MRTRLWLAPEGDRPIISYVVGWTRVLSTDVKPASTHRHLHPVSTHQARSRTLITRQGQFPSSPGLRLQGSSECHPLVCFLCSFAMRFAPASNNPDCRIWILPKEGLSLPLRLTITLDVIPVRGNVNYSLSPCQGFDSFFCSIQANVH